MASTSKARSVLGKGFAFPFALTGTTTSSNRGIALVSEIDKVRASLMVIIGTLIGARIMRRKYGCGLRDLVFDPLQPEWELLAEHVIRDSIGTWEKRCVLGPLKFDTTNRAEGVVSIEVEFRVIKTQQLGNLVYPLYLIQQAS